MFLEGLFFGILDKDGRIRKTCGQGRNSVSALWLPGLASAAALPYSSVHNIWIVRP